MKKIYIRCDAGNVKDFGTGHVSRMIILAQSLRKKIKRIEIRFLTRKDKNFKTGAQMILRAGFKILKCEDRVLKPNSQDELKLFKEINADLLINQDYEKDMSYVEAFFGDGVGAEALYFRAKEYIALNKYKEAMKDLDEIIDLFEEIY